MDDNIISIAIFEDHPATAHGVKAYIEQQSDLKVILIANTLDELMEQLPGCNADLVICDILAPGITGLEAVDKVRGRFPKLDILVYSLLSNPIMVENLLQKGIRGFVNKRQSLEDLVKAIYEVADGRNYLSDEYTLFKRNLAGKATNDLLSAREMEVLQLIVEGKEAKEIAVLLSISHHTVNNHRVSLFRKLQVKNSAELVKAAFHLGLVQS
jgi:two-component system, NarL family, invasion response regulator UvrY